MQKCCYKSKLRIASLMYLYCNAGLTCGRRITCSERVSNVSRVTDTDGAVTLNPARCSDATDPRAGVHTLVSNTCQGRGTVGVDGALGLALNVGVALEAGVTSTGGCSVPVGTLSIDATGRGSAGINDFWCRGWRWKVVKKENI